MNDNSDAVDNVSPIQEKNKNQRVEPKTDVNSSNKKTILIVGLTGLLILIVFIVVLLYRGSGSGEITNSDSMAISPNNATDNSTSLVPMQDAQDSAATIDMQPSQTIDAVTERNIFLRNNWTSFITADRSDYTYEGTGGISGLSIIVNNNTEYKLDNVTVKVTIKTVNNYAYKTEMLFFENIKPNSRIEQYVTPTDRGRYVNYEITSVYSDQLNFMWNEGDNTGNGSLDDPWKSNL